MNDRRGYENKQKKWICRMIYIVSRVRPCPVPPTFQSPRVSIFFFFRRYAGSTVYFDRSSVQIVTCAADGQVRLTYLSRGRSTLQGVHDGRAHRLVIEPGSPYRFMTCGEDVNRALEGWGEGEGGGGSLTITTSDWVGDGSRSSPTWNQITVAVRCPNRFSHRGAYCPYS